MYLCSTFPVKDYILEHPVIHWRQRWPQKVRPANSEMTITLQVMQSLRQVFSFCLSCRELHILKRKMSLTVSQKNASFLFLKKKKGKNKTKQKNKTLWWCPTPLHGTCLLFLICCHLAVPFSLVFVIVCSVVCYNSLHHGSVFSPNWQPQERLWPLAV